MTPERTNKLLKVLSKRQANLTVVLENVQDPHNVSAVMRTCDAVGIQDVYVLTTKIAKHKKWGYRSSSSALKWLTIHEFDNLEECITSLRKNFKKILTTHLSSDAVSLHDINFSESIALVFGNEVDGVQQAALDTADHIIEIPQFGTKHSLNVSVCAGIVLWEFTKKYI